MSKKSSSYKKKGKKKFNHKTLDSFEKAIELLNNLKEKSFDLDWKKNNNAKQLDKTLSKLSEQLSLFSEHQAFINKQRKLFDNLNYRIRQSPQIDNLLSITVKQTKKLLKADRVVIYRFNRDWSGTIIAESVSDGFPVSLNETIDDPCFDENLIKLYLNGRIRVVNDVYEDEDLTDCITRILEAYKIRAKLIVPIINEQKLYGLLIAQQCTGTRIWQDIEIKFLSKIAKEFEFHLSYINSIERQNLISKQRQLLKAISTRVKDLPDQQILFEASVEGAKQMLELDRVVIYKFEPDWSGKVIAECVSDGFLEAINDTINDPCFKQIYSGQYESGRIRAVDNVYEEEGITECYLNMLERYQVKSNLIIPLRVDEKLYGLLIAHQCSNFRYWKKGEIDFMTELGMEISYCLNDIHSIEKQKTIARQKQLLTSIAARVRDLPNKQLLFNASVEGAKQILNVNRVVIYKFEPDWSGKVIAECVSDGFMETINDTINDPCFKRIYSGQYLGGRIRAVNNVYEEKGITECYLNMLERYQVKSNLVVPLRVNEKLYGLLIAHQCINFRHWEKTNVDFMAELAMEISYSLEYIYSLEKQEKTSQRAWFFGDIAFRARQSLNLDDIFQATVQGARQMLETDRVVIYKFNPDWSGTMIAESVADGYISVLQESINDPCFKSNYVELYKKGRTRAINNVRSEPNLTECHVRNLEKYQVKANLVVPIRQDNELMGLLIAHECKTPRVWTKEDIQFFSDLATQVEYAVDHLSYIEKIKTTAGKSRLFGDVAFRARQSLDKNHVLRSAVQGARKELETDRVVIYKFNSDWSGTMIVESVGDEWTKVMNERIDDPCFRGRYVELYKNGRVRAINDIYSEPGLTDCHIRTLEQYDVKANLIAPIRKDNKLYGLLIAHHCRSSRMWQKPEIEFFSELATQTEYALDHISFIEKLEMAKADAEKASIEQRRQKEAIEQQLEELIEDVKPAFEGNLTVSTKVTEGEIGQVAQFVNSILENLQKIVEQVKSSSEAVIETVSVNQHEIETTYRETLHQAEAITIVLEKIQQMNNSIQKVAHNSQKAKEQVKLATATVEEGDQAMNLTVEGILVIQETVEETALKLKSLGEASQKISRVVNLIKDLASQTHVLALNASIEANDVQKQGSGFTVVAEEVRSLSEQSTSAADEIEEILEEIQLEVNKVSVATEKGREQVIMGVDLVGNTRDKINSITNLTGEIRTLVESVAQEAIAHAETSALVSKTMEEVEVIAQKTSAQSVKGAESFTNLLKVAQDLQESVAKFKVEG